MAMTITGGLSKSERQHVQRRLRAAMAAQVVIDGKHQDGRAPYGYQVIDAGPHPNPRKAQEGYRLRVLAVDEVAAPVVERIFALYLEGVGHKGIAQLLNAQHIPCPAAHTPHQNRHRAGDGWQGSTVREILCNPRYTGYAIYGRCQKVEELLDPDDVAAGHVVRYKRSSASKIVRPCPSGDRVGRGLHASAAGDVRAGWSEYVRASASNKDPRRVVAHLRAA
ncbi:hypothetical protein JOF29_003705 [Kribbella aluminosa]|uniref:Recombinase domain-containing protein n=1 Tax=Kribbella aluminosa TaxID=416017 RepID=A0ABS4ULW4_9ACTN|nr:recombinase family protein [Kribbella aluminosa]MBP2352622.1 hypothetical protein [Kribbella aluminosa]